MSILLIEDDSIHSKLIRRAIEKSGYNNNLFCLTDGEEAIKYLFSENFLEKLDWPKLILLDINIPKINGIEVLRRIKTDERLMMIPVVILSTSQSKTDQEKCYSFHANSYVSKPLNFDELKEKINSITHYWLNVNDFIER